MDKRIITAVLAVLLLGTILGIIYIQYGMKLPIPVSAGEALECYTSPGQLTKCGPEHYYCKVVKVSVSGDVSVKAECAESCRSMGRDVESHSFYSRVYCCDTDRCNRKEVEQDHPSNWKRP